MKAYYSDVKGLMAKVQFGGVGISICDFLRTESIWKEHKKRKNANRFPIIKHCVLSFVEL